MWLNELYQLYEANASQAGVARVEDAMLLPLAHSEANAQITVTIGHDGAFRNAELVADDDRLTMIPATEDSAARSNGIFPHPLCDKLIYVAPDYPAYVKEGKDKADYHQKYIVDLAAWCASPYSHAKAQAVLAYLQKGRLIADLAANGVLKLDAGGKLDPTAKLRQKTPIDQSEAFIRWRVEPSDNSLSCNTWQDASLAQAWAAYDKARHEDVQLCYVSGQLAGYAAKHPARIRNGADKAKLLSSNDTECFTFRGRFATGGQAFSVGYETSQKAHNALRWILSRQGYRRDGAAIVAWERDMRSLPPIFAATDELAGFFDDKDEPQLPKTGADFSRRLAAALAGYRCDLDIASKVDILGLDSALEGKGRLAVTLLRIVDGPGFLDRIESWHRTASWKMRLYREKQSYTCISAPAPRDIALYALGHERNGKFVEADEKLLRVTVERLLPCIVDGRPLPTDLVSALVAKTSSPTAFKAVGNWEKTKAITCAMIRKQLNDRCNLGKPLNSYEEVWTMALNESCRDRSYLFGRLLAVADRAEFRTYKRDDTRPTNARRYMKVFSTRPARTWGRLYQAISPYLTRLTVQERLRYQNLLREITNLFQEGDYSDQPLDSRYILGFECQAQALWLTNDKEGETTND